MVSLQHAEAGNSREVQVEDNQIQLQVWIGKHLQRLFAVPRNVKLESDRAGGQHLLHEECISRIIFDKKNVGRFHFVRFDYQAAR